MSETPARGRPLRGRTTVLSSRDAARPLTEQQGRDILVRLVTGDRAALDGLTAMPAPDPISTHAAVATAPPHGADPVVRAREFGLVVEHGTGEAHVVVGRDGMVEWAPLLDGGRCVAHLHPLITMTPADRRLGARWSDRAAQPTDFGAVVGRTGLYGAYVPTGGDLGFTIARALAGHTVYTPYRIQGSGTGRKLCAPETAPDGPLLSWEISGASETDTEYHGLLTALADHVPFWNSAFTANRRTCTDFPTTTGYVLATPEHYL